MLASIAHIKIIRTKYSFFVFMIFCRNPRVHRKCKKQKEYDGREKNEWARVTLLPPSTPPNRAYTTTGNFWTEYYQNWSGFLLSHPFSLQCILSFYSPFRRWFCFSVFFLFLFVLWYSFVSPLRISFYSSSSVLILPLLVLLETWPKERWRTEWTRLVCIHLCK